jgi:hypothetical protein
VLAGQECLGLYLSHKTSPGDSSKMKTWFDAKSVGAFNNVAPVISRPGYPLVVLAALSPILGVVSKHTVTISFRRRRKRQCKLSTTTYIYCFILLTGINTLWIKGRTRCEQSCLRPYNFYKYSLINAPCKVPKYTIITYHSNTIVTYLLPKLAEVNFK